MSSQRSEREWHEVFDENIIDLIEEILYFRLKLLATGCEQAYTWPEASDSFDLRIMRNQGARLDKNVTTPEVLFTRSLESRLGRQGRARCCRPRA